MWLIYMMYPEVNTAVSHRRGATLTAQGLIRIDDMHVGHAPSEGEAKRMCVRLALQTLKDRKLDTTVVGYGIKNYYDKKHRGLSWKLSIQQVIRVLAVRKARRDALKAAAAAKLAKKPVGKSKQVRRAAA